MDCETVDDMNGGDGEIRPKESTTVDKESKKQSIRIKIKVLRAEKGKEIEEQSDGKDAYVPPPPPPPRAELDDGIRYASSDESGSSGPSEKPVVLDPKKTEKGLNICTECCRAFKSAKSLHGHMRCHPERNYRGMNPSSSVVKVKDGVVGSPSRRRSPSSSSMSRDQSHFNWPRWRRGRMRRHTSLVTHQVKLENCEESESNVTGEVEYAAISLMMLSRGETDETLRRKTAAAVAATENGNQSHNSDESESNTEGSTNNPGTNSSPEKNVKRSKGNESEPDQTKKYQCDICSRFFSTYQALGGHKASHNKGKNTTSIEEGETLEDTKVGEAGNGEPSTGSPATKTTTSSIIHQCKKCNAPPFATGQALGGHMRKHYQEDVVNAASKKLISPPSDIVDGASKKPFSAPFDLNEVPKADEEENKIST